MCQICVVCKFTRTELWAITTASSSGIPCLVNTELRALITAGDVLFSVERLLGSKKSSLPQSDIEYL